MSFAKTPKNADQRRAALRTAFGDALPLSRNSSDPTKERLLTPAEIKRFERLPINLDAGELLEEVRSLLTKGVAIDAIYVDLLAPAARRLGGMWEDDACDFVEVTMGLWRLQEVMHEISVYAPRTKTPVSGSPRALFMPIPGDQHFLGPQVLEDVFARAGWDTLVLTKPLRKEVLSLLSREHFDLVGLTLSRDCPSASIRKIISAMRSVSRNEQVSILAGGRMINQNPAIVAEVGADGTGTDARAALQVAEALVQSAKVRAQTLR